MLALILYRQAEVYIQSEDVNMALSILSEAKSNLRSCVPAVQVEGRDIIQKAIKLVSGRRSEAWPEWRWQYYDDVLRVSLLFHL